MMASITPLGERGRGNRWWRTAAALAAGCVAGGWALGLAAGAAGRLAAALVGGGATLEPGPASVLAAAAAATAGVAELAGWRAPSLRRQVSEAWMHRYRGWVYGSGFGVQLGVAVATTITTPVVHAAVALMALAGATGHLVLAQVAGAGFGLARACPVLAGARLHDAERVRRRVRRVAAAAARARVAAGSSLCAAGVWAAVGA